MSPSDDGAVIQYMLDQLENPIIELTKWEDDFIESIRSQFEERHSLSIKQREILEKIYNNKS